MENVEKVVIDEHNIEGGAPLLVYRDQPRFPGQLSRDLNCGFLPPW
jgi:hypothetical protein